MKKALSVLVPVLLALALYGVMLRFAPLWISIACMSIFTIAGMAQAIAAAFSHLPRRARGQQERTSSQ